MISPSIESIRKLRSQTLLSVSECKHALRKSGGDLQLAKNILRTEGLAIAKKRKYRRTKNGAVFLRTTQYKAVILELDCETEFVAINELFISAGEQLCSIVLQNESTSASEEMKSVVMDAIAIIRENIILRNITFWSLKDHEILGFYRHENHKKVALTKLKCENNFSYDNLKLEFLANELAMHICANDPSLQTLDFRQQPFVRDQEKTIGQFIVEHEINEGDILVGDFQYLQVSPYIVV